MMSFAKQMLPNEKDATIDTLKRKNKRANGSS